MLTADFQKTAILHYQLIGLKFNIKTRVNFENNVTAAI